MITKGTYGMLVFMLSMALLLFLLICSFVVSFHKIDLLYIFVVITFLIKYFRMK